MLTKRGYKNNKNRKSLLEGIKISIDDPVKYKSQRDNYKGRRAYYDAGENIIHINALASYENGDSSSVLLHELLHAFTVNRLSDKQQREKFEDILNRYQQQLEEEHGHRNVKYTTDNALEEFVADIWSDYKL
jgi:Zn-dependent peptidase ImmA (M78 family)